MNININQDACIGCGMCQSLCSECFQLNDETGKAEVAKQECSGEGCDPKEAERSCPVGAIEVEN